MWIASRACRQDYGWVTGRRWRWLRDAQDSPRARRRPPAGCRTVEQAVSANRKFEHPPETATALTYQRARSRDSDECCNEQTEGLASFRARQHRSSGGIHRGNDRGLHLRVADGARGPARHSPQRLASPIGRRCSTGGEPSKEESRGEDCNKRDPSAPRHAPRLLVPHRIDPDARSRQPTSEPAGQVDATSATGALSTSAWRSHDVMSWERPHP
jgi:hypothetical protein